MNDSAAASVEPHARRVAAMEASEVREWPRAAALWAELTEADPQDHESQLRLAEALFFAQHPAEAARVARLAARLRPKDHRPLVVLARAESILDPLAAIAAWRGVLALVPREFEAWARLAALLGQHGSMAHALEALVRALALRPDHPFALALAGRLLGSLPTGQREGRVKQAMASASPDAALALLHVHAQLQPQDMRIQAALAEALLARHAQAQALPPLRALAQANPQAPAPLAQLAQALHHCQHWPEAARRWRRLLHLRPGDRDAARHLAEALRRSGDAAAALDATRQALIHAPEDLGLLHEQARCLAELGPAEAADAAWATALAAHPHDKALGLDHITYQLSLGYTEPALAALDALVGPAAGFDHASLLLLRLLRKRLPAEAVLRRFDAALDAGLPAAADATALEIALRCGLLRLGCGRVAEAATLLEPAQNAAAAPGHLTLRAGLRLLLARGEDSAAHALAEQALTTHRQEAWAWQEVLSAFREPEDADFATGIFRRASNLFRDSPADWLRVAAACQPAMLATETVQHLAELAPQTAEDALRASRIALRLGEPALGRRLLDLATPEAAQGPAWQRQRHLLALADQLCADNNTGEAFRALLLQRLASLAAAQLAHPAWAEGPIVLAHQALGAGGAGRAIAATLRGLAEALGGSERLHLVCTRLTEHPDRRLHLAAVQETCAAITDLSGLDVAPLEASGLGAEAQDLLELLGPGVTTRVLRLYAAFLRLRPAVVHLWHDDGALAGAIAAMLAGVPRVLRAAHASRPRARNPRAWQALAASPRLALANSSAAGATEDAAWLALPPDRIQVLRHGFDLDRLIRRAAPARAAALRANARIPPEAPVIGGAMRLTEAKRPLLWIAAAAALARLRPDAHFVLLGEGLLRDRVVEQARADGLGDRLHLPGRADPAPWLRLMDVVLLTSIAEGLPRTLVAAQALGRPVVATRVGGVAETLLEGVTGFTVPADLPGLQEALAERLHAVLADRAWLACARVEAPRFVGTRFSLQAMAQHTLALYGLAEALPEGALPCWRPPVGEAEREAAIAATQRRDWPAAQVQWDQLLALLPQDEEALLGAAGARLQQNLLPQARQLFARALREGAGPEALRGLARTLRAMREEREALPLWEALLRQEPRDLEAMLRCAETRARMGELSAAIAVAEAGRRLIGQEARLVRLLARLHAEAGNPGETLRHWNALAEALPRDAEAQLEAGLAAQAIGNTALAERRLRAALAGPTAPRAAAALVLLLAPTQPMAARAALRQGLRQAPGEALLWRSAAQMLHAAGRSNLVARGIARLGQQTAGSARLALADRLLDADQPREAMAVLQSLLADPALASSAARRLVRLALQRADLTMIGAIGEQTDALPASISQEMSLAIRFCAGLRTETGERDPSLGLWHRVTESARRRGYPRYLPRRDSLLHLVAAPEAALALELAQAEAQAGASVTVLHAEAAPPPPTAGITRGCLTDRALAVPDALAALPELAVPPGAFGEALRPRVVGQAAAALAALQPATLMLWSLPTLAEAALAALAQGVPRLVLCATGPAPNLLPAPTEAALLRTDRLRRSLRTALLRGNARLWHAEPAALPGWVAWLALDATEAARCCGTGPTP